MTERGFVFDGEAFEQSGVYGEMRAAIDAQRGARPRDEEEEGATRIAHDVAQAIDAVIAAPVGHHQGVVVMDAHKTGLVAAWRAVNAFGADGGERGKGADFDKAPIIGRHGRRHLDDGSGSRGGLIERLKLVEGGDPGHAKRLGTAS